MTADGRWRHRGGERIRKRPVVVSRASINATQSAVTLNTGLAAWLTYPAHPGACSAPGCSRQRRKTASIKYFVTMTITKLSLIKSPERANRNKCLPFLLPTCSGVSNSSAARNSHSIFSRKSHCRCPSNPRDDFRTGALHYVCIGNESAPILLAQCRFSGTAISKAKKY